MREVGSVAGSVRRRRWRGHDGREVADLAEAARVAGADGGGTQATAPSGRRGNRQPLQTGRCAVALATAVGPQPDRWTAGLF